MSYKCIVYRAIRIHILEYNKCKYMYTYIYIYIHTNVYMYTCTLYIDICGL